MFLHPCIDWPTKPAHAHQVRVKTFVNLGHMHLLDFFSYAVNGSGNDGHVHEFQGTSSIKNGHFHRFLGTSGPAIPLANSSHYHPVSGKLNDEPFEFKGGSYKTVLSIPRHPHVFSGFSGTGIGYEPTDW